MPPPLHRLSSSTLIPAPPIPRRHVAEIPVGLDVEATADPFLDIDVVATVTPPDGVPADYPCFWAGEGEWRLRYAPARAGLHHVTFRVAAGPARLAGLPERHFEAIAPAEPNALLARGGPVVDAATRRFFRHEDGEPFLWLADSWWFGMSARLRWPDEFLALVRNRAAKGFSVIQFAAGFACDVAPYDPRDANEAGHIWEPGYRTINTDYFDRLDDRILALVTHGLVPNVVGMWGYHLPRLGVPKVIRHWRYLVARYGALPVTWTLCGESRLIWYLQEGAADREAARRAQIAGWTEVARDLRAHDPWQRPLTLHVGPKPGAVDEPPLDDLALLDFHFLQPGHSEHDAVAATQRDLGAARATRPGALVLVGECCFEGMHGGAGPKVQRNLFWTSVLSGMPGYSYGVDALWQMNRRDDPFGPSVGGQIWGNAPWDDACHWEGSAHVGLGRRLLLRFPWWRFEPHPEWIDPAAGPSDPLGPYCAGIPGHVRLVYFPRIVPPWGRPYHVRALEPGVPYRAAWLSPLDGTTWPIGAVAPDPAGSWRVPFAPILHDWLLVLQRAD